nr:MULTISPECIES: tyrosine-type recombinase/integrase [Methylomicrobium]
MAAHPLFQRHEHTGRTHGRIDVVCVYSARRESEITRLEWADVNRAHRTIWVRNLKDPKKRDLVKKAKLPLSAYKIIMRQPQTSKKYIFPYNSNTIGEYFSRACRFLQIEDLRFHDLRHEATSQLLEHGLTVQQVQQITLHSGWSISTDFRNAPFRFLPRF